MNLAVEITSVIGALAALGTGMFRLGSGLIAMSQAIRDLKGTAAQLSGAVTAHETRIARLEGAAGVAGQAGR